MSAVGWGVLAWGVISVAAALWVAGTAHRRRPPITESVSIFPVDREF